MLTRENHLGACRTRSLSERKNQSRKEKSLFAINWTKRSQNSDFKNLEKSYKQKNKAKILKEPLLEVVREKNARLSLELCFSDRILITMIMP